MQFAKHVHQFSTNGVKFTSTRHTVVYPSVPRHSVLSYINKINENILSLRLEYSQLKHKIVPLDVYYDLGEEIMETLHEQKQIAELYDPLENMCENEPHSQECKVFDV